MLMHALGDRRTFSRQEMLWALEGVFVGRLANELVELQKASTKVLLERLVDVVFSENADRAAEVKESYKKPAPVNDDSDCEGKKKF